MLYNSGNLFTIWSYKRGSREASNIVWTLNSTQFYSCWCTNVTALKFDPSKLPRYFTDESCTFRLSFVAVLYRSRVVLPLVKMISFTVNFHLLDLWRILSTAFRRLLFDIFQHLYVEMTTVSSGSRNNVSE